MAKLDSALKELAEVSGAKEIDRVDPTWLKMTETPGDPLVGKLLHVEEQAFETGKRCVYTLAKKDGTRVRLPGQTNLDGIMATIAIGTWVCIVFTGYEKARNGQKVGKWEVHAPKGADLPAAPAA